jgi:transposase-like protein
MAEMRRKFDADFREGAVRLVRETGKPIAQVARDLGINPGTLGNWVNADRDRRGGDGALSADERAEQWAGSRGRLYRVSEGAARRAVCGLVPGAGGVPVLVLQVERR